MLVVVILLGLLVARLRLGPTGRMLLAIRSNERAAGSVGINVAQGKLLAFGLAAFIAGIGGALTGYMQGELTADSFAAFTSIGLLAIVFVAGVGRIAGRGRGRRHVLRRRPLRHLPQPAPQHRQLPGDRGRASRWC